MFGTFASFVQAKEPVSFRAALTSQLTVKMPGYVKRHTTSEIRKRWRSIHAAELNRPGL
jgi:hypothetical protein